MLESYKIGVELAMNSNITPALEKVIKQFEDLRKIVKDSQTGVDGLARTLGDISKAMAGIAGGAGGRAANDIGKLTSATDAALKATERLGAAMRANAEAARGMTIPVPVMPPGGGNGPRNAGGGGGHDLMLAGIGASMAGTALTGFYAKAMKDGFDAEHIKAVMSADDRVTPRVLASASEKALEVTRSVPGSTITGNLGLEMDLKQVTGNMDEALAALPQFAKLVGTLEALHKRGGGTGDPGFAAAKAMEILGRMVVPDGKGGSKIDVGELANSVELLTRVGVSTNNRVDPAAYLAFAKQARVGGMALNQQALFEDFPALMMVLGGSRTGTGESASYQQFINGTVTENTAEMLKKFELLDQGAIWGGGRVSDMQKHLKGSEEFAANPVQWVRDILEPQLRKMGISDPVAQAQAVSKFSGRITTAGFLGEIVRSLVGIDKEGENIRHTTKDSFNLFQNSDPTQAVRNFDASFHNMLTTLGEAGTKDAVAVLQHLTTGMNDLADWAKKNPDLARVLVDTAAGLGAIATAVGTVSTAIFLAGPALRLMGISGTGAAAAEGAAGAGGGTVAGGAAAFLARRFGLFALLYPSEANGGEEARLKQLRAQAMAGASASPAPGASGPVPVVVVNGRTIADGVADHIGRGISGAPTRGTGPDARFSPYGNAFQ